MSKRDEKEKVTLTSNDVGVMSASEAMAMVSRGAMSTADDILDGAELIETLLSKDHPTATLARVIKLKNTPELPVPAIRGKFLGYEPIMVTTPGKGGDKTLMNFVLIQAKPGLVLKHLGTSQIMQGLAVADVGDVVTIVKPNVAQVEIEGGKRVTVFLVLVDKPDGQGIRGYATPFGEWGKRALESKHLTALPAGKEVADGFDPKTGEELKAPTGDETPAA